MSLASNHAGFKRALLWAGVVTSASLLSGCPQLLSDDFRIGDASRGAAGLRGATDRSNTAQGAGGSSATPPKSSLYQGGAEIASSAEFGGSREQSIRGESALGGTSADSSPAVEVTNGTPYASGGSLGADRSAASGGVPGLRSAEAEGGTSRMSSNSATAGATMVDKSPGGRSNGAGATGGRPPAPGGSSNSGWLQNHAGGPTRAGAPALLNPALGGAPTPEISDCSNMVVLSEPMVANFDEWDGITDPHSWRFAFNGGTPGSPVTATFERYEDGSGDYSLTMVQGAIDSSYAVRAYNPSASRWGGGVKLVLHCFDASSYQGVSFWIRGATPAKSAILTLGLEDNAADWEFIIPVQWQQMRVKFADFSGWGANRPGRGIVYIAFSSQLRYVASTPQPGPIEIVVDEISFFRPQ